MTTIEKAISPGGRPADDSHFSTSRTSNWVARAGGLPTYILEVAHALIRHGHPEGQAISIAVATMKRWSTGKGVSPKVQAAAVKALAQWEAMKAGTNVKHATKEMSKRECRMLVSKFQNANIVPDPAAEGNNLLESIRATYAHTDWKSPQGTMPYTTPPAPVQTDTPTDPDNDGDTENEQPQVTSRVRRNGKNVVINIALNFAGLLSDSVEKGDKPGHKFHGNQWTKIAGSGIIQPYEDEVHVDEKGVVRGVDPQTRRPIAFKPRRKQTQGHSNTNPLDRGKKTVKPSTTVEEGKKTKKEMKEPTEKPFVNPTLEQAGKARQFIQRMRTDTPEFEKEREYANEILRRAKRGEGVPSQDFHDRYYPTISKERARQIRNRIYASMRENRVVEKKASRFRRKRKTVKLIGDVTLLANETDSIGKRVGDKKGHAFHGNQWVKVHVDQKKVDKFRATGRREHAADPSLTVMLNKPLEEKDAVAILRRMLRNPEKYKGYDTSKVSEREWLALHSLPKGYINKERFGANYHILAQLKTKTSPAKGQGAVKLREKPLRPGGEIRKGNALARKAARNQLFNKWMKNSADGKVHCVHCDKHLTTVEDTHFDKLLVGKQGGTYDPENVVPACTSCNQKRGERLDWVGPKGRTAFQSLAVWLQKNPKMSRAIGYRTKHRTRLARAEGKK